MAQFVIFYIGGKEPESPEAGQAHFARWQQWLGDLGPAVVNPGQPLKGSKTISNGKVTDTPKMRATTGWTIVEAADQDAALKIAADCPFTEMGDLEVAELQQMNM